MGNDTNTITTNQELTSDAIAANAAPSPLEQLEALRASTVSKEEYERVVAERNQMFQTLAHQPAATTVNQPNQPTAAERNARKAELRKSLYDDNCDLDNLTYWKNTLELRKLIIEDGGRDPFLPWGKDNAVDEDDRKVVDRVVAGVQSCIDYADGDSVLFTNELQRITIDTPQARVAAAANRR